MKVRFRSRMCFGLVNGTTLLLLFARAASLPAAEPPVAAPVGNSVHWAYRDLSTEPPSLVRDTVWPRTKIDRYVLAQLERAKIKPSPAADRYRLIKRLGYDLLGLPPTVTSANRFANDPAPDAYERLIDRLLASPHLGERWGRHWLDKARYADSDGFEKDSHRPDAWRYRDWLIHAINRDVPYDQFTIQQLAGDLLPDAGHDERLATAFHRQTLTNTEGGADKEQWRVFAVMDRTETLGTVWLGLTVGCSRCHDHKYDDITQKEYYELYAYFNNGDETKIDVPRSEVAMTLYHRSLAQHQQRVEALEQQARDALAQRPARQAAWEQETLARLRDTSAEPIAVHPLQDTKVSGEDGLEFAVQDDGSYLVSGKEHSKAKYTVDATLQIPQVTGFRLEVLPHDSLPEGGPGRAKDGNFTLSELRIFAGAEEKLGSQHRLPVAEVIADSFQDSWPAGHTGDDLDQTGWSGQRRQDARNVITFLTEKPITLDGKYQVRIVLQQSRGDAHLIGRFQLSAITGTHASGLLPESVQTALATAPDQRQDADTEALARFFAGHDPPANRLESQLARLKANPPPLAMLNVRVISPRTKDPRTTHILRRGEFKQPMDEVQTGTLSVLPEIKPRKGSGPTDRLDLAHWLVGGNNPLAQRVAVNHLWKNLFGEGLVRSVNDFGVRGERPAHARLLDHVAGEIVRRQWSRKSLIRYILTSATYRQASRHRPELVSVDPTNQLLYRQNRYRVEAEIVRDIALEAGGLLSERLGGPSVFPPIPKGVTDLNYNSSFKWKTSSGENRYRRGLYTYFKRTAPHSTLMAFDCPDSNTTNVDRPRSNTPLAALISLNNEVFVEAAQSLAQRVLAASAAEIRGSTAESGDTAASVDSKRLAHAFQFCVARRPKPAELSALQSLLDRNRQRFSNEPEQSEKLVAKYGTDQVTAAENAAWVATVRIILNLDEFLTRE